MKKHLISQKKGGIYEDEWRNYLKERYGIYNYSKGSLYKREWKNGLKEGYGIYCFPNNDE